MTESSLFLKTKPTVLGIVVVVLKGITSILPTFSVLSPSTVLKFNLSSLFSSSNEFELKNELIISLPISVVYIGVLEKYSFKNSKLPKLAYSGCPINIPLTAAFLSISQLKSGVIFLTPS
jgi:hypothetical protein